MLEKEPQYFKEFRKEINGQFGEIKIYLSDIDKRLVKVEDRLVKVEDKLDSHFEEIGELKVEVTKTNILLRRKVDYDDFKDLEHRTKKLENVAFA